MPFPGFNFFVQALIAGALAFLTRPKPEQPKPGKIEDLQVPNSEEGQEVPVIFGTVLQRRPSVLAWGDYRQTPVKSKTGKK